jgi:hypothetical protein
LLSSLYPPKTILLRRGHFTIRQDGHTEAWMIDGGVGALKNKIIHDDWKKTDSWLSAQARYMHLEKHELTTGPQGFRDWLRAHPPLMPLTLLFYCLFGKGLILDGRAGLFYSLQRMIAEATMSLMVLESRIRTDGDSTTSSNHQLPNLNI